MKINFNLISNKITEKKHLVLLLSISLILVIVIVLYLILNSTGSSVSPLINSVPVNSGLIIKSSDLTELIDDLQNKNKSFSVLKSTQTFSEIDEYFSFIQKTADENSDFENLISNKTVYISAFPSGHNKMDFLFSIEAGSRITNSDVVSTLKKVVPNSDFSKNNYENATILKVTGGKYEFCFSVYKGILLLSINELLIETAVRQINSNISLTDDPDFVKVTESKAKNVNTSVYFNIRSFPKLIIQNFSNDYKKVIQQFTKFADWTALETQVKSDCFNFTGFTYSSDSSANFINIFKNQSVDNNDIINLFPDKTAAFLAMAIEDTEEFRQKYIVYLNKINLIDNYNAYIKKVKKQTDIDIDRELFPLFGNEIAIVDVDKDRKGLNYDNFLIVKTKNSNEIEDLLWKMTSVYAKSNKLKLATFKSNEKIGDKNYTIYSFPFEQMMENMLGNLFSRTNCKYYILYSNYIVFSFSKEAIIDFVNYQNQGRLLINDNNYKNFNNSIWKNSNIYFYSNIRQSNTIFKNRLSDDRAKQFEKNSDMFGQFEAMAIQYSYKNGTFYTNSVLKFNPVNEQQVSTLWEIQLDNKISSKPYVFTNPTTKKKEIFVQDDENNIYLLSESGKILWKKNISEKIEGTVFQVDCYKNGKLQFLFGTNNSIHLIDRNGKYVDKFPIKLKSPATNNLSVIDYEKNRNYRLFIACKDKKVYCYNIAGKTVDGWDFSKTDDYVSTDVQYYKIDGNDYLIFADKLKIYILNRKGDTRVKLTASFPKSAISRFYYEPKTSKTRARFVTTSSSGIVHFIYLDGSVKKMTLNDYSAQHNFEMADINGDNQNEFIFSDGQKLEVYSSDKEKLFSHNFENNVDRGLTIFSFGKKDKKIGISISEENKIYLINSDGSIYGSFPLKGSGSFSIISDNQNKFNVIVGNNDNFLFNYQVK